MDARVLQVLKRLSDGQFHSGAALGDELGLTRTAIWKHLAKFSQFNIPLERHKGRGYRIPGGIELLDKNKILKHLNALSQQHRVDLDIVHSTPSTNGLALKSIEHPSTASIRCILAEHQSAGRGRYGRSWVSPFGQNIYLSMIVPYQSGVAALEGLSLAVGVAIANSLKLLKVEGIKLKWPNDLWWQGKKLGGILIEMVGDTNGCVNVVVGIGINVNMSRAITVDAIDQPWIDLCTLLDGPISRNTLLATMLNELLEVLVHYEHQGFSDYQRQWQALDALYQQPVSISTGGKQILEGIALGVNEQGALRVQTEDGMQLLHGGEISVRPMTHDLPT